MAWRAGGSKKHPGHFDEKDCPDGLWGQEVPRRALFPQIRLAEGFKKPHAGLGF